MLLYIKGIVSQDIFAVLLPWNLKFLLYIHKHILMQRLIRDFRILNRKNLQTSDENGEALSLQKILQFEILSHCGIQSYSCSSIMGYTWNVSC